jgi:inhibitor of KinA
MTSLQPLGDQALLASFATEADALRFAAAVRRASFPWLVDVVQAYATVAVFFAGDLVDFASAAGLLRNIEDACSSARDESRIHHIPCCYDMQLDLPLVSAQTGLQTEDVIRLHCSTTYTVFAIGFCPGFPYLGYLPPALRGVPRQTSPRLRIEAGSVGMTGRQTGIYTEARPGGWNIIARTPLELVNVSDGYFPLQTGDRVQFVRIDQGEFQNLIGRRL